MKGTLSQLVSLSSAANGVIAGRVDAETLYPDYSEFKFCNSVRFVDIKTSILRKPREVVRHRDPNEWLCSLKPSGVVHAWLAFSATGNSDASDHQLAAFVGGGGDWRMVVATAYNAEIWISRWDVTEQNAADERIWGVTYGCVGRYDHVLAVPEADLKRATTRLRSALKATERFAAKHDHSIWADQFQRAIDCLDSTSSPAFPEYVRFICLDSYPITAQRLLAAAYSGWVFGGMGSWNDLYFETRSENDRYYELSAELYSAINDSIQQATWSFGKHV